MKTSIKEMFLEKFVLSVGSGAFDESKSREICVTQDPCMHGPKTQVVFMLAWSG